MSWTEWVSDLCSEQIAYKLKILCRDVTCKQHFNVVVYDKNNTAFDRSKWQIKKATFFSLCLFCPGWWKKQTIRNNPIYFAIWNFHVSYVNRSFPLSWRQMVFLAHYCISYVLLNSINSAIEERGLQLRTKARLLFFYRLHVFHSYYPRTRLNLFSICVSIFFFENKNKYNKDYVNAIENNWIKNTNRKFQIKEIDAIGKTEVLIQALGILKRHWVILSEYSDTSLYTAVKLNIIQTTMFKLKFLTNKSCFDSFKPGQFGKKKTSVWWFLSNLQYVWGKKMLCQPPFQFGVSFLGIL